MADEADPSPDSSGTMGAGQRGLQQRAFCHKCVFKAFLLTATREYSRLQFSVEKALGESSDIPLTKAVKVETV